MIRKKKERGMTHSLRAPSQWMLVFIRVKTLKMVDTATMANTHIV